MVSLAYESPGRKDTDVFMSLVLPVDIFTCFAFTAEATLRIVAVGFLKGHTVRRHFPPSNTPGDDTLACKWLCFPMLRRRRWW
jgi:hypothetical protein